MSYGISIRATSKAEAAAQVGPKFDDVVTRKPGQTPLRATAQAAAEAALALVREPAEPAEGADVREWLQLTISGNRVEYDEDGGTVGVTLNIVAEIQQVEIAAEAGE